MLREYQQRTIDQLYAWFESGKTGNPCLVLPTGSGKSHIIAALCKDALQSWPETRILMLTHVKELIEQNAEKMRQHWPNAPMGIYSAGLRSKELGEPITFAGIQSVRAKAAQIGHVDLVIIDECFIAGTKISTPKGLIDIDKVRCGDLVYNQSGIGTVEAISCKSTNELYKVEFDNGNNVQCTGNHQFFTNNGWKSARELENGTSLFSQKDMLGLWDNVFPLGEIQRTGEVEISASRTKLEKAKFLLRQVCEEILPNNFERTSQGENQANTQGYEASPYSAWRERAIATLATNCVASRIGNGMDRGTSNKNLRRTLKRDLSQCLQSGYCESGKNDCDRVGRRDSLKHRETESGQEKGSMFGSVRVVSVSSIKPKSPELVFNLQVSGHPSYFANGVAVHNCHLVAHKDEGGYRTFLTAMALINPNLRIIGLTASPYRLGHGYITDKPAIFDALIEPVTIEELIHKGFLSTLRSKLTTTKLEVDGVHKRGGEYIDSELQAAVDTKDKNSKVVHEVIKFAVGRKSWLFFCAGVAHAHHIKDALVEQGIVAECVTGDTPSNERSRILAEFKAGRIQALTNANVLTTGFDAPMIDLIAMLRPTMSPGLYVQMAGRGLRIAEGKTDCLVLDFAGVVEQHGPITAVKPPPKKGDKVGEAPVKVCDHCQEICALSVRVCPACGEPFPEPVKAALKLSNLDIMGVEGIDLDVSTWTWRKHISKASNKDMLSVTYYGGLSDMPVTEYLAVTHEGYAGETSRRLLADMAHKAGIELDYGWVDLHEVAQLLTEGRPPASIEFKREGRFFSIINRTWNL